jgi:MFS family permease
VDETGLRVPDRVKQAIKGTLALSMLLASLGTSIANIALPELARDFPAPFPVVQMVVVAYLGGLTLFTVIVGRLGDTYGLRRSLIAGLVLFSVASLLCAVAPGIWFLVAARAVQGVGAAFLMTLAMALMRETASGDRIGRAMGLLGTVSAIGTALGPVLGGVLIAVAGWRSIFLVQVPPAVLALSLAVALLPNGGGKEIAKPAAFRAVLNGRLAPNLLANLLVAAVMMTTLVVGPFYLGLGLGLDAALVGLAMAAGPVIAILSGMPAGRAVDAWGPRRVSAAGLALLASGALLLAVLPNLSGVAGYVLAVTVLTPGYQLFQAANNTASLADIPTDGRGLASGLLTLSRNVGLIAGASAMGTVFALAVGTGDFGHASAWAIADGMRSTFIFAAIMIVVAIVILFGGALLRVLTTSAAKLTRSLTS